MAGPRCAAAMLACLVLAASAPAAAARRPVSPDQSCVPPAPRTGYYGATISQSFRPRATTIASVDVLLASVTTQRIVPRIRLVGQHTLPNGLAVQTVVLGQRQQFVSLPAFQPTWVRLRLPKPVVVSSVGPTVDQFAVQVALPPNDDSVFWLNCDGYIGGIGQVDTDPGMVANRDSGTAVAQALPHGLAFREYSTRP